MAALDDIFDRLPLDDLAHPGLELADLVGGGVAVGVLGQAVHPTACPIAIADASSEAIAASGIPERPRRWRERKERLR